MDTAGSFSFQTSAVRSGPPAQSLEGVRTRRVVAFCIDLIAITALFLIFFVFFSVIGLVTFGLGWIVIPFLYPAVALFYNGFSISSWRMATFGMRMADLEMRLADGGRAPFLNAAAHAVLFYLSWTLLTPLVLVVSLFTRDKRCLHDIFAGVIVTRRL